MNLSAYFPPRQPAGDYAEAAQRIAAIRAAEPPDLHPVGGWQFLAHHRQTDRAVVLFHGYTNCPQQFKPLGEQLHQRGDNVLIPRVPGHGLANRLTDAHAHLTAEQIVETASAAIDIAQGLVHDLIDPDQPAQRIDYACPILIDLQET